MAGASRVEGLGGNGLAFKAVGFSKVWAKGIRAQGSGSKLKDSGLRVRDRLVVDVFCTTFMNPEP